MSEIVQLKKNATTESFVQLENEFWFSAEKQKNLDSFKKIVEKKDGGMLNYHGRVVFSKIQKIILNETSSKVYVSYLNKKNKATVVDLDFGNTERASQFGHFIPIAYTKKT